jgi:hypothetical protein
MSLDQKINQFCRVHELIFVEEGFSEGDNVYWFIDFGGNRLSFTGDELTDDTQ